MFQKENNVEGDAPVVMIADTFPRRPVGVVVPAEDKTREAETAETTTTISTETTAEESTTGNSTKPLAAYFKYFLQK